MTMGNSSSRHSPATQLESSQMGIEISNSVKIFLGVFIILLAIIGIIGNIIVVTVLRLRNIFTRKTTSLILTSLAAVDLLGCTVDIPLAFSTMVATVPDGHVHNLSLAQVAFGPFLFLGYITCFFLLSIDWNDALRKASSRQVYLTTKRILAVLTLAVISGVAMSSLFVIKIENPSPLLPRKTEPIFFTIIRSVLFLAFVIAVSSNIYYFLQIRKLIKRHSENVGISYSQMQRNQWHLKERDISWTVIQIILVVCLSYTPYIVASIIYNNVDARSLNGIAICRSLTYLKYAVNSFIFTKLDGRFLRFFVDIVRGADSNKRKNVVNSFSRRVNKRQGENRHKSEDISAINKRRASAGLNRDEVVNLRVRSLAPGEDIQELGKITARELTQTQTNVQAVAKSLRYHLPMITMTSPQGRTTALLKEKKPRNSKKKDNVRKNGRGRRVGVQSEAAA